MLPYALLHSHSQRRLAARELRHGDAHDEQFGSSPHRSAVR